MNWDIDILKKEAEILKKIHAFYLYKEKGLDFIDMNFPKLKSFILENETKTPQQLEKEQMNILEQLYSMA
jgi:hypothetical protein